MGARYYHLGTIVTRLDNDFDKENIIALVSNENRRLNLLQERFCTLNILLCNIS